jgi:hypothetical protein
LTTNDPQILQEEAQDEEEEALFEVGDATPHDESPGAEESRLWTEQSEPTRTMNTKSPLDGHADDEFKNPWGGSHA